MVILIKALQVILALSLLILVHELGHFFWARVFGIKVDKFFLFFDIGGKALARWKWGETEFGIGWLPFGGYCKISGMVDESMDLDQLKREPQPWEFRSHNAWHRLAVMAGGVINNFIFALLTFIAIMAIWGRSYIPNEGSQVYVGELAYEMGFRSGDCILAFDDYEPKNFLTLQSDLARRDVRYTTVLRGEDTLQLYMDQAMLPELLSTPMVFDLAMPFVVDSLDAAGANAAAGLKRGDKVVKVDTLNISFLQDARPALELSRGQSVVLTVLRGEEILELPVQVDTNARIGVILKSPNVVSQKFNLLEAVPAGIQLTGETIRDYLDDLKLLVRPSSGAYKSVGSFIAIGQVFPETWDWYRFLNIIALLSIMLAVINLVPIPGLDGGHIVFTLYEIITGRKPSEKFLIVAQTIGMIIIFALMFLAIGNDFGRLL